MANQSNWLPHLKHALPNEAYSGKISMYAVALEGWRRGLTLRIYNIFNEQKVQTKYSLSYNGREHKFDWSKGDKVSDEAFNICNDKMLTKEYLLKANIPTPLGRSFTADDVDDNVVEYAKSLGFPVVLKPKDGRFGKGVITDIKDVNELRDALKYVRQELNYPDVIVEQFISGQDYRIYVVDGVVISAIKRIPANIVGDGKNSIKQLIRKKNNERKNTPHLRKRPIKIDKEVQDMLKSLGLTLESIPAKGERIFLRKISNVSAGGDSIEVTDSLTQELKDIAIKTSEAIPGLGQCGIDLLVDENSHSFVVIEVNARAGLGSLLFPYKGQAKDIPKAIIDFYFPETKGRSLNNIKKTFYFDLDSILHVLQTGIVEEVCVPNLPMTDNVATKGYVVKGWNKKIGPRHWVQQRARYLKLHGFVEILNNGDALIVVAGDVKKLEIYESILLSKLPDKAEVESIQWDKPIKAGFHIGGPFQVGSSQVMSKDVQELRAEKKEIQEKLEQYRKKYKKVINSRLWRYTGPVRKFGDIIKRIIWKR